MEQAEQMAQKIQQTIAQSWKQQADSLEVTTSMGIALTPFAAATLSSVLKSPNIARYESKEAERSTYRIHCL